MATDAPPLSTEFDSERYFCSKITIAIPGIERSIPVSTPTRSQCTFSSVREKGMQYLSSIRYSRTCIVVHSCIVPTHESVEMSETTAQGGSSFAARISNSRQAKTGDSTLTLLLLPPMKETVLLTVNTWCGMFYQGSSAVNVHLAVPHVMACSVKIRRLICFALSQQHVLWHP